jgi:hypothetical protein
MTDEKSSSQAFSRTALIPGTLLASTLLLVACGGSGTDPDPGTPTTLVNSELGMSPFKCAVNGMCVSPAFGLIPGSPLPINTQYAQTTNPWVDQSSNTLLISEMAYVSGTVYATDIDPAGFNMTVTEVTGTPTDQTVEIQYRYFKGNGLPNFVMGQFPVQPGTPAYKYYSILPGGLSGGEYPTADLIPVGTYNLESYIPKVPVENPKGPNGKVLPGPISSLIVGISLHGVPWHLEMANSDTSWFNPYDALPPDQCWGHPYNKQYHIHAYSWKCFPDQGSSGPSPLFGYALDGYGIYGPRGEDGQMITNAQLDECHGHTAPVMWEGKMTNIYHYHLNREYPYSIGCFHGVVDYARALPNSDMNEGLDYAAIAALVPSSTSSAERQIVEDEIGNLDPTQESTFLDYVKKLINDFLR